MSPIEKELELAKFERDTLAEALRIFTPDEIAEELFNRDPRVQVIRKEVTDKVSAICKTIKGRNA